MASQELKLSSKQKKLIKAIEKKTGDKFEGSSLTEASEYIDKHKAEIDKIDFRESKKPSKKQLDAINKICVMYQVEFNGSTMKDACEFLDEWMPKYMQYWEEKRKGGNKDGK